MSLVFWFPKYFIFLKSLNCNFHKRKIAKDLVFFKYFLPWKRINRSRFPLWYSSRNVCNLLLAIPNSDHMYWVVKISNRDWRINERPLSINSSFFVVINYFQKLLKTITKTLTTQMAFRHFIYVFFSIKFYGRWLGNDLNRW